MANYAGGRDPIYLSDESYAALTRRARQDPPNGTKRTAGRFLSVNYRYFTKLNLPPEELAYYLSTAPSNPRGPRRSIRPFLPFPRRIHMIKLRDEAYVHYVFLSHLFNLTPERRTDNARVSVIAELIGLDWITTNDAYIQPAFASASGR